MYCISYLLFNKTVFGIRRFKVVPVDTGPIKERLKVPQSDFAEPTRNNRQERRDRALGEVNDFRELLAVESCIKQHTRESLRHLAPGTR